MQSDSSRHFTAGQSLVEARRTLETAVDAAFEAMAAGVTPDAAEWHLVDIKEESGRRGAGGIIQPSTGQNMVAADHLASEVACMANSPTGGALIVGIDDRSGGLIGTALDVDWLRHRIYERVDVAPDIEERTVDGVRLLVIYVSAAREPVEDLAGRLRWRVGKHCVPVDRAQWWAHRQTLDGLDLMAAATSRTLADCSPGAIAQARRYVAAAGNPADDGLSSASDADLLTRLGAIRPDGRLTQAAALVFCPNSATLIEVSVIDVEGGDVLAHPVALDGMSLLEQVARVEDRLDALDTSVTVRGAFAERPLRRLPFRAVREAVLNAVVHQDWMRHEPVAVRWNEADSALDVHSAGAFVGGVSAQNVLTHRYARYPALADLFRALRLVEKQGMGVDRMFQEMVSLGHRPPLLRQEAGPHVHVRLDGGRPAMPVLALTDVIRPAVRRGDVRIALIVHTLLTRPFVTARELEPVLQRPAEECQIAIAAAAECRVDTEPLVVPYKDVWALSTASTRVIESHGGGHRGSPLLPYRRPEDPAVVALPWLKVHQRMTSSDHAFLTGLTQPGALKQLERLAQTGVIHRGEGGGRNAHFVAAAGSTLPG